MGVICPTGKLFLRAPHTSRNCLARMVHITHQRETQRQFHASPRGITSIVYFVSAHSIRRAPRQDNSDVVRVLT
jgi:hypothetical protein